MKPKFVLLALLSGLASLSFSATFTQADLEKMVRELEAFAPQNPKYKYPIQCEIEDDENVNAYATAIFDKNDEKAKPQAKMVVFTGLVNFVNGDHRIIRAVVAHEICHLSEGHVYSAVPRAEDLNQFWNRAQETEADTSGAILLQRAGYSKKDMIDMLLKLEEIRGRKGGAWFQRLTGTHPDPKARAARLADDPSVMRSLLAFDAGLAFMDRRDFGGAVYAFDKAATLEPKLREAVINAAQSNLMQYHDELSSKLREQWFRVDFGPVLKDPGIGTSKDDMITDQNRRRYAEVMNRLGEASKKLPGNARIAELMAVAQVLEPDGNASAVLKGAAWLADQATRAKDPATKLRFANNAAVGFHRLNQLQRAYEVLINAQQGQRTYNAALAENLGRLQVKGRSRQMEALAADVMYTWLKNSPKEAPNWSVVHANYQAACKALNIPVQQIDAPPMYLTAGISINIGDKMLAALMAFDDAIASFGNPDARIRFDDRYPDVMEVRWQSGAIRAYTQDDQLVRVTSFVPGSTVTIRPTDESVRRSMTLRVGMTKEEFNAILPIELGAETELSDMGKPQDWLYFSPLSLGVLFEGDKVKALTITPISPR